ncbi:MAG: hypothetical protein AUK35_10615 [Zetaproteobacteria bacterium CG2_30_46_52]|nr:MAG: hypothetical protein AUK35_10615 [Zetaproteobacteria bacterium CG2_30_46_52]
MQPISVILVEDEKPTRDYFAKVIDAHAGLSLLAKAGDCATAIEALQKDQPQVLVCDLGLPDGQGIDVIHFAKARYPNIEILVVTMMGDEAHVVEALEAGASGYLLKKQAFDDLAESILCLKRGEAALSPEIARFLLKRFNANLPIKENKACKENPLTDRESEVLILISKGYSYDEIASAFGISTNTVRTHIRNIYRKLSVCSRSEAVFEASQLGLINL